MQIDPATVNEFVNMAKEVKLTHDDLVRILGLLDLTSLNKTDNEDIIRDLCKQAVQPVGHVAAVCVHQEFIPLARTLLKNTPVKVASVANFPAGMSDIDKVTQEIKHVLDLGAQEVDLVMPYQAYLSGNYASAVDFIKSSKIACGPNTILKVIIETGALREPILIASASYDAINAGADFVKTSTGKIKVNATLESAAIMLLTIKQAQLELKRKIGFKASGGIKTSLQAASYLKLADLIMGDEWISVATFRFGASSLLVDLLSQLGIKHPTNRKESQY